MCAIFGMSLQRPLSHDDIAAGQRAVETMRHRGPDGHGTLCDEKKGLFLGHRRLAVIDLDNRAQQPMQAFGHVISFNGEVYNFRDLKKTLQTKGYVFETESDTEVLLAGWHFWGEGVLEKIDGMFAFALRDGDELVLAVDPFGEKPLYVETSDDGIRFASELIALRSRAEPEQALSRDDVYAFLSLGYVPSPHTGFAKIHRLEPGTILRVANGCIRSKRQYWQMPRYQVGRGTVQRLAEQDIDRIRDALAQSIERRMISDAPLSLFLSSGVDSTLIALLCRYEFGLRPKTLTVAFKGSLSGAVQIDETGPASQLAQLIESEHHEVRVDPSTLNYGLPELVNMFSSPMDNSGAFAVKLICSLARRFSTVGLTGLGGDELSFGYGKVHTLYRLRGWTGLPVPLQNMASSIANPMSQMFPRLRILAGRHIRSRQQAYVAEKNFPAISILNTLPNFTDWTNRTFPSVLPAYAETGNWDLSQTMSNSLLLSQDHASMSESVELRSPFLSRDLVEVLAEFDARSLFAFGRKEPFHRLRQRYLRDLDYTGRSHGFLFSSQHLLKSFKADVPKIDLLPYQFIETIWARRFDGEGWTRLALRLAILEVWQQRNC